MTEGPRRAEFYRARSPLLAYVLCRAAVYVKADAQAPGRSINTVSGSKRLDGDPFLQR